MQKLLFGITILLASLSARAECPTETVEDCAALFSEMMSQKIANGDFRGGDYTLESITAEGKSVHVLSRASITEAMFPDYLSFAGVTEEQYLAGLREGNIKLSCLEPTRSIISAGGTVVHTNIFKDGAILLEQTISSCP